jgi:hypothetical protein
MLGQNSVQLNNYSRRPLLTIVTFATVFFCFFIHLRTMNGETNNGFVQIGIVETVTSIPYSTIANKPLWIISLTFSVLSLLSQVVLILSVFLKMSIFRFRITRVTLVLLLITNCALLIIFRNLIIDRIWCVFFILLSVVSFAVLENCSKQ